MDRIVFLPYRHASRAEYAGHVFFRICKAIHRVEDNTSREGGLQDASADRYGRAKNLVEALVVTILQMGLVPAALAGDVAA